MTTFLQKKRAKMMLLELEHLTLLVYFPPIMLLLILQWHTRIYEETFDVNCMQNSSNNAKYLKFHCQRVESTRNDKLRRLSRRFKTLIWRPGNTVQNLESPGLYGRVESTKKWRQFTLKGTTPSYSSRNILSWLIQILKSPVVNS